MKHLTYYQIFEAINDYKNEFKQIFNIARDEGVGIEYENAMFGGGRSIKRLLIKMGYQEQKASIKFYDVKTNNEGR
jgi:hypothetical protein